MGIEGVLDWYWVLVKQAPGCVQRPAEVINEAYRSVASNKFL